MKTFIIFLSFFFMMNTISAKASDSARIAGRYQHLDSQQFQVLLNQTSESLVVLCVGEQECKLAVKKANYLLAKTPEIQAYVVRTWNENIGKMEPFFRKEPFKIRCESEFVFIHDQSFFRLGQYADHDCPIVTESDLVEWMDRLRPKKIETDVSGITITEITESDLITSMREPNKVLLLETGAKWCAWCVSLQKELRLVKLSLAGRVDIYSMNYDKEKRFLAQNGISTALPGLTLFRNGKIIAVHEGYLPHEAVLAWITAELKRP